MDPEGSSGEALTALKHHFGLSAFRPKQAEVVESVLSGRNTVVVMPTGAGKSLCYQLPAVMRPGMALVISPLLALMHDQVESLTARGIAATAINSALSESERAERLRLMREGAFKLVYVAPERLRSPRFFEALGGCEVSLLAVDEAHCISEWGHNFRPDYALIGQLRKRLRPPRTVALTATATPEVRADIVKSLLMKDPNVFVAGFDRPNLFLEVAKVAGDEERRRICEARVAEGGSGIIYCSTRKAADALYERLRGQHPTTVLYHAGLKEDARRQAQETFMSAKDAVAVATNAFGMGIDKPDLRFVIHAQIPRAVEAYYQESGRAGRDGAPADALLLFNHADVFTQERLLDASHPPDLLFSDIWRLLENGEPYVGTLSALANQVGSSDYELSCALKILEREGLVQRGRESPVDAEGRKRRPRTVIRPLKSASFSELGLDLSGLRRAERRARLLLKRMTDYAYGQSCRRAFVLRYFGEGGAGEKCGRCDLCAGPKAHIVAPRRKKRASGSAAPARPGEGPGAHNELAATELRRWRKSLASDLGLPAFVLFNDRTLFALATELPVDRDAFLSVHGTSEKKWERFGPKVVEICLLARAATSASGHPASANA